ncbi:MAG: hypothetical protein DMG67_06450 [Acidobacteria bacterium]|nr:MAG: hypothetical protein DMG67_06450 [Acidobacteriota bacterium]
MFMTRFRLAFTLLFGMLLALCTTAYAQKITSTLTGTVVDSTNAVVSDAAITVTNQATGTSRSTKTNPEGQYSVPELDPGVYSVKVNKAGFKEVVQKNLELHVGDTRELRTELPPGQASESMTVEANAITVETQTSDASNTVLGQQVRDLPLNGRNFIQLTTLMPGVAPVDGFDSKPKGLEGGVQMGVSGGGGNNNLWSVDGANNNDVGSNNTILVYPSIDAISEFPVSRQRVLFWTQRQAGCLGLSRRAEQADRVSKYGLGAEREMQQNEAAPQ